MKQHELNTSMNVKEIHQNIEGQDKNLEQRISNRKKGRNRSASPRSPAKNGAFNYLNLSIVPNNDLRSIELESDRSGGLSKPLKFEIFEKELEKTMEKFILKRINDSHKIRKKYKEQIEDVRAMGNNEIIRQLVKEMETSRNKELEDLEKQIEIARMLEIQEIKEKFGNNSVN